MDIEVFWKALRNKGIVVNKKKVQRIVQKLRHTGNIIYP